MTVEEATNRLVREMELAIPLWEDRFLGSFASVDEKVELLSAKLQKYDAEVETAFTDLIQAIMEEQDG